MKFGGAAVANCYVCVTEMLFLLNIIIYAVYQKHALLISFTYITYLKDMC